MVVEVRIQAPNQVISSFQSVPLHTIQRNTNRQLSHVVVYHNDVFEICSATHAPRANIVRATLPASTLTSMSSYSRGSNTRAHLLNEQYRLNALEMIV